MGALTAEQFCKGLMACRDRMWDDALAAGRHEFGRLRFKRRDRRIKFVLGLLTAKIAGLIEIGVRENRPSIKLAF
jgi:hypothetical protein